MLRTKILKKPVLIVLALSISSCATVQPTANHVALSSWLDLYYEDVIYQLGEPNSVFIDGVQGRVLVYDEVLKSANLSELNRYDESFEAHAFDLVWLNSFDRHVPTRVEQYADLLYVNKDGIVYSFQSNKSNTEVRRQYENSLIISGIIATVVLVAILVMSENNDNNY